MGPSYDEDTEVEEDEDTIEGDDETVFKYKVNKLRPQSQVFLQMLNDMRRRSKELPEGSPAEEQYRFLKYICTLLPTCCKADT